jgi:hypothetical protein
VGEAPVAGLLLHFDLITQTVLRDHPRIFGAFLWAEQRQKQKNAPRRNDNNRRSDT